MVKEMAHSFDQASMPDLRIMPLDKLVQHERHDVQRTAPLAMRIATDGVLKNPLIVTPLIGAQDRFVVLDGINRYVALSGMGCPHLVVQVVPYEAPQVMLSTWNHALTSLDLKDLMAGLAGLEGLESVEVGLLEAQAGLARREFLACIRPPDGRLIAVQPSLECRTLHQRNQRLNAFVDIYQARCRMHRTTLDDPQEVWKQHPALTALVLFPDFQPAEVLLLAREGELLPAGLTRHLIQRRALSLNYPLSELRSYDGLEEKNKRFAAWVKQKLSAREVRFYAETTFLFDE